MKVLETKHDYDRLKRRELRQEEYELHEDLLLLASFSEAAAKAAYFLERSTYAEQAVQDKYRDALKAALERMRSKYLQIDGYVMEEPMEAEEEHD